MKKRIRQTLQLVVISMMIAFFCVMGIGYVSYQDTMKETPIRVVVDEVRSDQDYVPLEEINRIFLDAIVAIEDHRYYEHGAIDLVAIMRATAKNMIKGRVVQGGSTITQQLAKNLFLSNEQTFMRKLEEIFIAEEFEKLYTKEEILELYVNVIYYGDGNTGIGEASRGYFDKAPSELSYEEATLLAGLPQAPSRYALSEHYNCAINRQKQVLAALNSFYQ